MEFYLGSSYYPEWWPEEEWEEDFAKMESLGLNVVRMGEFAWSWYEPREGEFNFEPMRRAIDLAAKHGIKTVLGTTTAVCPPWLYQKDRHVKGGNIHGDYSFGGRKGQCLSNETFLKYARRITLEQAKALGDNPNIIGWQLDNEPGFPFNDFDGCCNEGFRDWLREKYGNIDALNKAWFSMMWSNYYNDFDQIEIPVNAAEGGWSPQVQIDYRRYFSFTFNSLLSMEAEIIRKYSPDRFIYTNWPGANWSVDCFEGAEYLDYAGWDNYVGQPAGDAYRVQLRARMEHSFDRRLSSGKERFLVAEQLAFADANNVPEVVAAQTWLNISHGAFATIFFEWRSPTGGAEEAYPSLLMRDKSIGEAGPVIKKMTDALKKHYSKIDGASTPSKVAAVYSHENSWAHAGWVVDGFYDEEFFNAYGGFKNALACNVDVASMRDDLSKYKLVIAPNLRMMTREDAKAYTDYVKNGGILVMNTECATRDFNNQIYELLEPGLLSELFGAEVISKIGASKLNAETGAKASVRYADGTERQVRSTINKLRLKGADVVAEYTTGRLAGTPAITVRKYGEGYAVLYSTDGNDVYFYEALAGYIKNTFGIESLLEAGDGVIVSSRVKEGKEYIFAVNAKDSPVEINIPYTVEDVINGGEISGRYTVEGYGVLFALKNNR